MAHTSKATSRLLSLTLLAIGAVVSSTVTPSLPATAASRPNVVVIMTDDQTLEQVRVMDNVRSFFQQRGTWFDNSVASYPLCCPSRATLLTGQYAIHHGVRSNTSPDGGYDALDHSNTLPVWLQNMGYQTIHIGKYLNGYGTKTDPTLIPPGWSNWQGLVDRSYYDYTFNDNGVLVSYGDDAASYQTDVIAGRAVSAIRAARATGKPFFLNVAPHAPHTDNGEPPAVAARHQGFFAGEALPASPAFNEADVNDKPAYIRNLRPATDSDISQRTRYYQHELGSLLAVDDLVRAVTDTLTAEGVLDTTLVIFTSDNGFMSGQHRLLSGKGVPYDESLRVPLLVAGPGFPAGVHIPEQTVNVDLAPTIAAVAGATMGRPPDGVDLRDVVAHSRATVSPIEAALIELSGGNPWPYDDRAVLLERYDKKCYEGVHTTRYAYVRHRTGEEELYDLPSDPWQLESRHADPNYASVKSDLAARLDSMIGTGPLFPCGTSPRVWVGDSSVVESLDRAVKVKVPVTLDRRPREPVRVAYTTVSGSAVSGSDFTATAGTLVIPTGVVTSSIDVIVRADRLAEPAEQLGVEVTAVEGGGARPGRPRGTVVILDAPVSPDATLSAGDAWVVEGDENGRGYENVFVPVTLSWSLPQDTVLTYTVREQTAVQGSDFRQGTNSVTIKAGRTWTALPVQLLPDDFDEPDESFVVDISSPAVPVLRPSATVTIIDNETE